jgi:hypothetical protein
MGVRAWRPALSLAVWLSVPAAPATADAAPGSEQASSVESATHPNPERAALQARLDDIRRLLSRLDDLETPLIAQAEQALDRADTAQSHDERARQERLYGEIGARIAELRATRRDIALQLQVLEQTLADSATTQPDR